MNAMKLRSSAVVSLLKNSNLSAKILCGSWHILESKLIQKIRGFPKRTSSRHVHILSPLILAACGSSGQQGGSEASISLSSGSYSGNLPDGFALTGSSSATIQVLNMSTNSDEILLSASGTGQLEFSFVDPNDKLTLQSGSKVSGFNTLKITNGAVDVTQASLTGIETI